MSDVAGATYQRCVRCVMDTTDPEITFDGEGMCSHCHTFDEGARRTWFPNEEGQRRLERLIDEIRAAGRGQAYDCAIGLSGGVDSSYLAYRARSWGLRILAIHVDAGWNSELAVRNIERLVKACELDLVTHVVDWQEMRDLQRAYLRASLANQDVPQDHVFFAALYKTVVEYGLRYVLIGSNFETESVLPKAWGYSALDARQLEAVHRRFGTRQLKTFSTMSYFDYYFWLPFVRKLRIRRPLNLMPYGKEEAKRELAEGLGWKDYGVKHGESRFTRFFQNHYLPEKFGYDKRLAHLSSLVLAGATTRDQALAELEKPLYDPIALRLDKAFVLKKLGLSEDEFAALLNAPSRDFRDYPSNRRLMAVIRGLKTVVRKLRLLRAQ